MAQLLAAGNGSALHFAPLAESSVQLCFGFLLRDAKVFLGRQMVQPLGLLRQDYLRITTMSTDVQHPLTESQRACWVICPFSLRLQLSLMLLSKMLFCKAYALQHAVC